MEIDGSYGEGGGQLLRFALALSALLGLDINVSKIRAGRSPPGIRPQHLAAINAVARLANAEVSGNRVGSSSVSFRPGEIPGGRFEFNVGTAGSVTLVLQAILPVALAAESPVVGRIVGGTEVRWSPTVDYFQRVFLEGIRTMGADVSLKLIRSGYYPRGGGEVEFSVRPRRHLIPIVREKPPEGIPGIHGISRCAHLSRSVAERQASSARSLLERHGLKLGGIEIVESREPLSPGSSITLWVDSGSQCFIGGDSIGERGKPAEVVGSEAARNVVNCVGTGSAVDEHFADMILPYMLTALGPSRVVLPKVTEHLGTEAHIATMFDVAEIRLEDRRTPAELSVIPKDGAII